MSVLPPSESVEPFITQQLHRRLVVSCAKDGLVIQPDSARTGVMLAWTDAVLSKLNNYTPRDEAHIIVQGIAGLMEGPLGSSLLLITGSTVAGRIDPSQVIHSVTSILSVPINYHRALSTIAAHQKSAEAIHSYTTSVEDTSDAETEDDEEEEEEEEDEDERVIDPSVVAAVLEPLASPAYSKRRSALAHRVISEVERQLTGQYFSYSCDITRSIQHKRELSMTTSGDDSGGGFLEPNTHLPLWRRADRRFFYNYHLMRPFVELGGYVETASIDLPLPLPTLTAPTASFTPLDVSIISRRSVERPGLRFQRRGVDSKGAVANFNETEFITRCFRDDVLHVQSFVQTRGSMPIFFSQSPFSLKPPPVLERTPEESQLALKSHFDAQVALYGRVVIINLAELTGPEAIIVNAYRDGVKVMNGENDESLVKYAEFDFHQECRGMKFENVSKLIDRLEKEFEELGFFWTTSTDVLTHQRGVFRTNCVDCLDRTSVVQSALSRFVFNKHLINLGLAFSPSIHDDLDKLCMRLWANNGDAISREYASSNALKGDFTRTGIRSWRGALSDGSSSLTRLLANATQDFFRQAVIDNILGVNLNSYAEFSEKLASGDPSDIMRLAKIRGAAIETSALMVIADTSEIQLGGWTLLSAEENVVKSNQFTERVVLLTSSAVYITTFNYDLMKVENFVRVPLTEIMSIQKGVYILSLDSASRDPLQNYGFVLNFNSTTTLARSNSYSVLNEFPSSTTTTPRVRSSNSLLNLIQPLLRASSPTPPPSDPVRFFAFKALRPDRVLLSTTVSTTSGQSRLLSHVPMDHSSHRDEKRTARDVTEEIIRAVEKACEEARIGGEPIEGCVVLEKEIISEADARANITLFQKGLVGLKHLVWL